MMKKLLLRGTLQNKVWALVALMCFLLMISVALVYYQHVDSTEKLTEINDHHLPLSMASSRLVAGVYQSSAAIRAFIITGDQSYQRDRINAWKVEILPAVENLAWLRSNGSIGKHDIEKIDTMLSLVQRYRLLQEKQEASAISFFQQRNVERSMPETADTDFLRQQELLKNEVTPIINQFQHSLRVFQELEAVDLPIHADALWVTLENLKWTMPVMFVIILCLSIVFAKYVSAELQKAIVYPTQIIETMATGEIAGPLDRKGNELDPLLAALERLNSRSLAARDFAVSIGKGRVPNSFKPASNQDQLGHALLEMHKGMIELQKHREAQILRLKNGQLRKLNDELDKFLYSASHDLRAPLTTLMGLINLVRVDQTRGGSEEYLVMMDETVRKMDCVIRQIVQFSGTAGSTMECRGIDVRERVEACVRKVKSEFSQHEVIFHLLEKNPIPFFSDEDRFEIALYQVLRNAVEYSAPTHTSIPISIQLEFHPSELRVEIMDRGVGIPASALPRVFEMFFKGSNHCSGPGLGLYIAQEAVGKMGGSITVDSELGIGTMVRLRLPNNVEIAQQEVIAWKNDADLIQRSLTAA